MPPKAPKAPAKSSPPKTGWRASPSAAPDWRGEIAAARKRAEGWSLAGVLGTGVRNLMVPAQPVNNVANLLSGRIAGSETGGLFDALMSAVPKEPIMGRIAAGVKDSAYKNLPQPSSLSDAQAETVDPIFGGRGAAILRSGRQRRRATQAKRAEVIAAADEVVEREKDPAPWLERKLRDVSVGGVPVGGVLFDSRAGLEAGAEYAGAPPELGALAAFFNPLNVFDPTNMITGPIGRKLAGKKAFAPYKYEGVFPSGRRPFQPHAPKRPMPANANAVGDAPDPKPATSWRDNLGAPGPKQQWGGVAQEPKPSQVPVEKTPVEAPVNWREAIEKNTPPPVEPMIEPKAIEQNPLANLAKLQPENTTVPRPKNWREDIAQAVPPESPPENFPLPHRGVDRRVPSQQVPPMAPVAQGWRSAIESVPGPPRAPLTAPEPVAPPSLPARPVAPPEPPTIAPQSILEEVHAPSQPPPPPPRAPEPAAPPVAAAPDYQRIGVEGVREPVAPVGLVVGAGVEAPPGPAVAPPAPDYPTASPVASQRLPLDQGVSRFSRSRTQAAALGVAGIGLVGATRPDDGRSGPDGAWPDWARKAVKIGLGAGALAVTSKLAHSPIGKYVGGAWLNLADAAMHGSAKFVANHSPGFVAKPAAHVARNAKALVDRFFSRRMLTDNVARADLFDEMIDYLRDMEAGSMRRANDMTAPLRAASRDERLVANAALQDPAVMSQLKVAHPTLAASVGELRAALDTATHRKLAAQFQTTEAVWTALSDAQQRELADYIKMTDEVNVGPGAAMASPATSFEAFKAATLAKMKASGAIRKNAEGKWATVGNWLDVETALDNLGKYAPRKYAAFEGGAEAFDALKAVEGNASRHKPGSPLRMSDDERKYFVEEFGPRIQSALASKDMGQVRHLIERENVSPAIRDALGELKEDPGYRVAQGLSDLERDVARSQAFEAVAVNPDWVMPITDDPDAVANAMARWKTTAQPYRVPNDPSRYGILADRHVHPEIGDVLRLHFGESEQGLAQTLRNMTNWWKGNVTVLNPDSQARQWMQNFVQGDLAGAGAVGHMKNLRETWGELRNKGLLYEQARDAGLFSGTYHDVELTKELHEQILSMPPDVTSLDFATRIMDALGKLPASGAGLATGRPSKGVSKFANETWQMVDDWHRLAVFKHAIDQGKTAREALKHVRETLYDGSKMSRFERMVTGRGVSSTLAEPGKGAKALDLLSTVVNAPFGMASIFSARNALRSLTGMKAGRWVPFSDPALALRASKYWALPTMIAAETMSEEDDAARPAYDKPVLDRILPLTLKLPNATSRFLGRDGKPQFFNYKSLTPWGEAAGTVYDTMDGTTSMVRALPGLGAHPFLQTLGAVGTNENPFTKRPIYPEGAGRAEIAANIAGYATQSLLPRWTPGIAGAAINTAQRISDGDPEAGVGSFLEDTVRYGGPLYQKLGAGFYNDVIAGRDNVDAHVPDSNLRDWTLPRAGVALAGLRTYEGDAERNESIRAGERRSKLKAANKSRFDLARKHATRSDEVKDADNRRYLDQVHAITTGEPYRLPSLADYLRR